MKAAWDWVKSHALALALGLAALLGAIAYIISKKGTGVGLPDAIALQQATREVATKEAQAAALVAQGDTAAPQVAVLQQQIADSKRRALAIHHGPVVTEMTDEQVADLFAHSGL